MTNQLITSKMNEQKKTKHLIEFYVRIKGTIAETLTD